MRMTRLILAAAALCLTLGTAMAEAPLDRKVTLEIPPQPIGDALNELARQTGVQVAVYSQIGESFTSPRISGTLTPREALEAILKGTGLQFEYSANTVIVMRRNAKEADRETPPATGAVRSSASSQLRLAQGDLPQREAAPVDAEHEASAATAGIPEILVSGKRSLNVDIERTEDGPQPYVIFGHEEIQRSQAANVEDFLRTRLPMNTVYSSNAQSSLGSTSSIDLRGLGVDQTLILVDGRRMPTAAIAGAPYQPDLNGIPLSAIERIEVLPSTAGGIYGGGATGGVVNIVLRRDYRGIETKATFANTFDTDTGNLRLELNGGFSLEGGRTRISFAANHTDGNTLLVGDRDFYARGIALQLKNNPALITDLSTPPLGATVNIRSAVPLPLTLKPQYSNGASLGQLNTYIPLGYAGPDSDGGAALIANAGKYNLEPPRGVNGLERGLVRVPSTQALSFNIRREFGSSLEAFLDVARFDNDSLSYSAVVPDTATLLPTAPNNPFVQPIVVRFPTPGFSFPTESDTSVLRGTAGLIARLPGQWTAGLDYGWSRSRWKQVDTQVALNALSSCAFSTGFGPGVDPDGPGPMQPCFPGDTRPALNVLQEGNTFPLDFGPYLLPSPNFITGPMDAFLKNGTLRLSGPVAQLAGGAVNLSVIAERREETLDPGYIETINPLTEDPIWQGIPERFQEVTSYYAEARIPLISGQNRRPFVHDVELQASVRHDAYRTGSYAASFFPVAGPGAPFPPADLVINRFSSAEGTFSVRYAPTESVALRASYGTGFLPPSVTQLNSSQRLTTGSLGTDRKRGDTPTSAGQTVTLIAGGNPNLLPEDSRSLSAGLILTPSALKGLRLSIDYTRIDKVNEIQTPTAQFLLDHEDLYPDRIERGAKLPTDAPDWEGPIIRFDSSYINIAKTAVEAWDLQLDYLRQTAGHGEFRLYVMTTWQPRHENQALSTEPVVESVGHTGGPLKWRGNMGLDWHKGSLTLGWNAQYYHSYLVYSALPLPLSSGQAQSRLNTILSQGSDTIPSQMYHDLVGSYSFGDSQLAGGLLANSRITVGVQNVFNTIPPILAVSTPGGNSYSHYGNPLLRRYTLTFQKNFGR